LIKQALEQEKKLKLEAELAEKARIKAAEKESKA
jgi:hypothetical protein